MRLHLDCGSAALDMNSDRTRIQAFSLVELFMVMTILGFTAAIVFPMVGRSLRGSRLRAAARETVMLGRYARSMAVLNQESLVLVFDLDAHTMALLTERSREARKTRTLDKVRIDWVEIGETGMQATDGQAEALYRNNGTCVPYRLRLRDEQGQTILVDVDRFSSATTENE